METRVNFKENGTSAMNALFSLSKHLSKSTISHDLLDLIYFRVSQINECCFCLDMHSKDLIAKGENPQRLFLLDAWREAPLFSDKERASLAFAESLTKLSGGLMPEAIYNEAARHFTEAELIDLALAVITINSWNRVNIAFGAEVGTYQVGQYN
jgi:AhpD family alkylhydroperoxidase